MEGWRRPLLLLLLLIVSQGAVGVINCIQAREQCNNDPSCRDVLNMLHKICGPELVACATVTPGKCRTLLKTLDNFEYLRTCSCGEPHMDFTCYTFRETIFNHPCSRAVIPVGEVQEFLPQCSAAEQECRSKNFCFKIFVEFINVCTFKGITCTSREMDRCNESWRKVRNSPLFGCICTAQIPPPRTLAYSQISQYDRGIMSAAEQNKEEDCIVSYNRTHHNPCLDGQKDLQRVTQVEASQTLCHVALNNCEKDDQCREELGMINLWCEHAHCEPDRCRTALQEFYQRVSVIRRLQVAFCVCRQSDPDGECLTAMRRLHPTCAERQLGRDPMKCHKIAEQCRQNRSCGTKLQEYEEKCAVDAMTGRCSHTHRSCQQAVMNILGTELHATCVCKGTDFLHQHDCYTWQKLLWSNPCVIESHLQLHLELSSGGSEALEEHFRAPHTTSAPPPINVVVPTEEPEYHRPIAGYGSVVYEPERPSFVPRPSVTYDRERGGGVDSWRRRPGGVSVPGRNFPNGNGNGNGRGGTDRIRGGHTRYPEGGEGSRREGVWGRNTGHRGPGLGGAIGGHRTQNGGWVGRRDRYPDQGGGFLSPGGREGGRDPTSHRGTPNPFEHERPGSGGRGGNNSPHLSREDWGTGRHQPSWSRGGMERPKGRFRPVYGEDDRQIATRVPLAPYQPETPTPPPQPTHLSTTTTGIPTTTVPQRTCLLKDRDFRTVMIPESKMRRLYRGEKDCSVLCTCGGSPNEKPEASCTAQLCTGNKSCNTTRARYPHTAPYVLAHRGDCVCYAGKFICQKPEPEMYTLGTGIYLFLGYSRVEVDLMKPHTRANELEALEALKRVLAKDYKYKCTLTTKKHIGENFIMVASLTVNPDGHFMAPFMRQRKEKEECAGPLEDIVKKINARPRHNDILTDAILSIFILAKVDVNFPEAQTSPSPAAISPAHLHLLPLLAILSVHLLAHWVVQYPLRTT